MKVLLDHDNREPLCFKGRNHARQGLNNDRRQALGNFIQKQQIGTCAQNTCNRQHLLLATRQTHAGAVLPFFQIGEHGINGIQRHGLATARYHWRQQQVFFTRQTGKDTALFGAITHTVVRNFVGGQANGFFAMQTNGALPFAHQAHDGSHGGGAACPIATQQRDHFTGLHLQTQAMQDV